MVAGTGKGGRGPPIGAGSSNAQAGGTLTLADVRNRAHGFEVRFFDIPVVNDFFRNKVRNYLGSAGVELLKVANPDRLPRPLRTNFYLEASLR